MYDLIDLHAQTAGGFATPADDPDPPRDCTCYFDCRADSHSGRWHQHEDEPCPVHPGGEVVG